MDAIIFAKFGLQNPFPQSSFVFNPLNNNTSQKIDFPYLRSSEKLMLS
jgi:hypothetical protein